MINLIPPQARKRVLLEYWIRAASVWMLLAGTALIMVALLNVPVWVLVHGQINAFADSYAAAESEDTQFKEFAAEIEDANEVAAALADHTDTVQLSLLLERLQTIATSEISIEVYEFSRTDGAVSTVRISGTANTRQALANLKQDIEADPLFSTAALPLSNLAKDSDIPFNIEITPAVSESAT